MFPYLKEGDIVFFKKYKKNKSILKNRQIVIFNHPTINKKLIKRINSVNQNKVEVIGDNIELKQCIPRPAMIVPPPHRSSPPPNQASLLSRILSSICRLATNNDS